MDSNYGKKIRFFKKQKYIPEFFQFSKISCSESKTFNQAKTMRQTLLTQFFISKLVKIRPNFKVVKTTNQKQCFITDFFQK